MPTSVVYSLTMTCECGERHAGPCEDHDELADVLAEHAAWCDVRAVRWGCACLAAYGCGWSPRCGVDHDGTREAVVDLGDAHVCEPDPTPRESVGPLASSKAVVTSPVSLTYEQPVRTTYHDSPVLPHQRANRRAPVWSAVSDDGSSERWMTPWGSGGVGSSVRWPA